MSEKLHAGPVSEKPVRLGVKKFLKIYNQISRNSDLNDLEESVFYVHIYYATVVRISSDK